MWIKQKTNYPNQSLGAGAVREWDDTEAARMIAAGFVDPADPPTVEPPATPETRKPKRETRG